MDYERTLVIILAIALAFLLALTIFAVFVLIKILRNVRHVTQQAESISSSFAAVGDTIKKSAVPTAVSGVVANAIGSFIKAKSTSSDKDKKKTNKENK
jgi:hypothetical protein